MGKEHLKNLIGSSQIVTDKPITKIINNQLDIKPSQFSKGELDELPWKKSQIKTTAYWFLWIFWFHTQKEDGTNVTSQYSLLKNSYN